jgi:hypothetical protein
MRPASFLKGCRRIKKPGWRISISTRESLSIMRSSEEAGTLLPILTAQLSVSFFYTLSMTGTPSGKILFPFYFQYHNFINQLFCSG